MIWTIRIITRPECMKCKSFIERFRLSGHKFAVMEESDSNAKQLDEWLIEKVPVIQILVEGKLVPGGQLPPGTFSFAFIQKWAEKLGLK